MHELRQAEADVEIIWRAFELRPEPVPTLDPAGEYLQRVWRDSVYPLAERLGVPMKLPPVQPRSRQAHEAAHWARTWGRFNDYNAACFRSLFEQGADIGAVDVLVRLAYELQLDGESLRTALAERAHESTVVADERAAELLGVSGVPAFVANRSVALSGAQPLANLRKLIAQARAISGGA